MKNLIFVLVALAAMIPNVHAQTATKTWGGLNVHVLPVGIPTSATTVVSTSIDVQQIVLINTTASAIAVTATDRQGSPVTFLPALTVNGNSVYIIPFEQGYYCAGGIVWSASGAGMNGYIEGRQQ